MKIEEIVHSCLDGFVQVAFKTFTRNSLYSGYVSQASYSPWVKDKEFIDVFSGIKAYTLVDKYKAYSLWKLVQQSSKLEGALVEVGVWKGVVGF